MANPTPNLFSILLRLICIFFTPLGVLVGAQVDCGLPYTVCRQNEGLATVPSADTSTEVFSLIGNSISTLNDHEFSSYINLTYLELDTNHLTSVEPGVFCGAPLTYLSLFGNGIKTFPDVTCLNDTLETIKLARNWLSEVKVGAVSTLPRMTTLLLAHNVLANIEYNAFCGTQLEIINLSNNSLTSIPNLTCIGNTLKKILINKNQLSAIMPADSFMHTRRLEYLDLATNSIVDISPLSKLGPSLEYMILARNQINHVGDMFYSFNRLVKLDLRNHFLPCFRLV